MHERSIWCRVGPYLASIMEEKGTIMGTRDNALLVDHELAVLLKCDTTTIQRYRRKFPDFPAIRVGPRLIRFRLTDVLEWSAQKFGSTSLSATREIRQMMADVARIYRDAEMINEIAAETCETPTS